MPAEFDRRDFLTAGCLVPALGLLRQARAIAGETPLPPGRHHTYGWINQSDGPRPAFAWENREDVIYHEIAYKQGKEPAIGTAPEFFALQRCPWVFNRAMRWLHQDAGLIVAYSAGGGLLLTGKQQVSAWYSDPDNRLESDGQFTRFTARSPLRRRDAAVLPSLQFHVEQHPVLEVEVDAADCDWQFLVSVKGRSGPPLLSSGWQRGPQTLRLDLAAQLRNRGYHKHFAELHFVMGLWESKPGSGESIRFRATLVSQAAVVSCLPVIRTRQSTGQGVPIAAVVTDTAGTLATAPATRVYAEFAGKRIPLEEKDGLWHGMLASLPVGEHDVQLVAEGHVAAATTLVVRITDGEYFRYDKAGNFLRRGDRILKPLTGSFQGTFYFQDVGTAAERMLQSQADWDSWDRSIAPGEHMHYWESLTESELDQRFAWLAQNGWDLVHLHSHYGIWERFDACGALCPHGVEQFATYVRAAARHGLGVMLALSSYPYAVDSVTWDAGTMPYLQYVEAGFKNEDWFRPENQPFNAIYHRYLADMLAVFREEPAVFSYSPSGEGDWKAGAARTNDVIALVRKHSPEHIVVAEPIQMINKLPARQAAGITSDLLGDRNYGLGQRMHFDEEMGILFRLNRMMPNAYLAEGCYPSSNLYTHMNFEPLQEEYQCWVGSELYRRTVRDTFYIGFVQQQPILVSWDEVFTEDERRVLAEVKRLIDWRQKMREPSLYVRVRDADCNAMGRVALGAFEKRFTHVGLDYGLVANAAEARGALVLDPADGIPAGKFESYDALPARLQRAVPFSLGPNYATHFMAADSGEMLVAYLFNTSRYETRKVYIHATYHRMPMPAELRLRFRSVRAGLPFRLYDLDSKQIVQRGISGANSTINIGGTRADYLLAVGRQFA